MGFGLQGVFQFNTKAAPCAASDPGRYRPRDTPAAAPTHLRDQQPDSFWPSGSRVLGPLNECRRHSSIRPFCFSSVWASWSCQWRQSSRSVGQNVTFTEFGPLRYKLVTPVSMRGSNPPQARGSKSKVRARRAVGPGMEAGRL